MIELTRGSMNSQVREANQMVEEMMLLANIAVAGKILAYELA